MLLTQLTSDGAGHLYGRTEEGDKIPLSVPFPNAVVGVSASLGDNDLNAVHVRESKIEEARRDSKNYYMFSEIECRRSPEFNDISIYVIPYVSFMK